jgi:nucleotide-binding universal stress UspA family protein
MKNMRLKNILVPTDFSPIARHALSHAEHIARLTGARITLLHVVEQIGRGFGTSGMLKYSSILEKKRCAAGTARLQRLARAMTNRSTLKVNDQVVIGRIAPTIASIAAKSRCDLIIMGTHGANGFVEDILGSTTYRLASRIRIPLLSVHRAISRHGYATIIFPVRDERYAADKLPEALAFAHLFRAHVHIVGHVPPDHPERETRMRKACTAIRERFARRGIVARTALAAESFFPDAIIRYAHDLPNALVVISQRGDFHLVEVFQGTFTKRILHKVLSPVLSVPLPQHAGSQA